MKIYPFPVKKFVILALVLSLSLLFSIPESRAQTAPLTLAKVLVGLQSESTNLTLAQKNEFITTRVQELGVTFRLTPEIEKEIRQAGASNALIQAIRLKAPKPTPAPITRTTPDDEKPDADYEKIWVDQMIVEEGKSGIRIYANFNVYNLKDVQSDLVFRLQKDGKFVKGKSAEFRTTTGDFSARRYLTPNYTATVYEALSVFVPYSEIDLAPGNYDLKLNADVILRDGTSVKHLTRQDVNLWIPDPRPRTGTATFEKVWVDYNVKQEGKSGMLIHVTLVVNNLKNEDASLRILFQKADGTLLSSTNKRYQSLNRQTATYRAIKPVADVTSFKDLTAFIPYDEFNLAIGKYELKMDVDLIYEDHVLLSHLTFHPFTYSRSK